MIGGFSSLLPFAPRRSPCEERDRFRAMPTIADQRTGDLRHFPATERCSEAAKMLYGSAALPLGARSPMAVRPMTEETQPQPAKPVGADDRVILVDGSSFIFRA